jgi:hypothetical protein
MSNFDDVHKQNYCTYYIKYYPEFKRVFGSDKAAIIFERLEYWSEKYSSGFWKFFEPCKHPLYRQGDSWEEEIGFSRKVFTKVFSLIGVHYKSKSEFLQQDDPFQGKLYVSYYDRKTNRTYFLRNHQCVIDFLSNLWDKTKKLVHKEGRGENKKGRSWNCPMGRSFLHAKENIFLNKEITSSSQSIETQTTAVQSEQVMTKEREISQQMLDIWNQTTSNTCVLTPELSRKLFQALEKTFEGCIAVWKTYCLKISSSKFLMGESPQTSFKAWLSWVIRPETVEKIMSGVYSLEDRSTSDRNSEEVSVYKPLKTQLHSVEQAIERVKDQERRRYRQDFHQKLDALNSEQLYSFRIMFEQLHEKADDGFSHFFREQRWAAPGAETMFQFFVHGELTRNLALPSEEDAIRQALEERGLLEKRQAFVQEIAKLEETKPLFKDQILSFVHRFTKPTFEREKGRGERAYKE